MPNRKTDSNNHGPFSTDNIGMNYDYPEATYERRRQILKEHETYQKGWLYFIANDPRVPADVRERMQQWGLPKDEFKDNGGWPHQIYVREARRMLGSFVMTENELMRRKPTPDSVGMGSYTIDSHNVQRYITPDGAVQNEGDIGVPLPGPYEIAYGSLVPKRGQASNLSCRCASRARTSRSARSAWSRCSWCWRTPPRRRRSWPSTAILRFRTSRTPNCAPGCSKTAKYLEFGGK